MKFSSNFIHTLDDFVSSHAENTCIAGFQMLSHACFEYCRFAIKCVPLVLRTHKGILLCGVILFSSSHECFNKLIVKTLN